MLYSTSSTCRPQSAHEANVLAPLTVRSCLAVRFQVAQIPEYKPVVAETKTSTCREQRNSLFGGKPFYSSSFRRWELQTPQGSAT